mmetsp:Transcript_106019/g.182880  ORF Transcript_106019/g.182880 Transcript_106019/m.182880 type:complete len:99 (-) Transcript_106019:609-905(-)
MSQIAGVDHEAQCQCLVPTGVVVHFNSLWCITFISLTVSYIMWHDGGGASDDITTSLPKGQPKTPKLHFMIGLPQLLYQHHNVIVVVVVVVVAHAPNV